MGDMKPVSISVHFLVQLISKPYTAVYSLVSSFLYILEAQRKCPCKKDPDSVVQNHGTLPFVNLCVNLCRAYSFGFKVWGLGHVVCTKVSGFGVWGSTFDGSTSATYR